jgi:hypothetical protein
MRFRVASTFGLIAILSSVAGCTPAPPACVAPVAPPTVDGSTASERQMSKAHDAVVFFQKQSDDYQTCLVKAIEGHHHNPPFFSRFYDDGLELKLDEQKHKNQLEKERVVSEFNAGVRLYNEIHP